MSLCFLVRRIARGAAFLFPFPFYRSPTSVALLASASAALSLAPATQAQTAPPDEGVQRVVVTATRFPTSLSQLPAGVQIITAEQIAESGAATVNEALMRVLGIPGRLDFFGGGDYRLDLRGFSETADNNQAIIVDGLRLSEPDLGGTRLSGIPIESVVRIEVLRGSSAVLYGEGATAGAIVITTRAFQAPPRVLAPAFAGTVHVGLGQQGSQSGAAVVRWTRGEAQIDISLKRSKSDNHRPNSDSTSEGAEAGLVWRTRGWVLGVRHAVDDTDSRLPGALPYADYLQTPYATLPIYADDFARIDNRRTQLYAKGSAGMWQLSAEAAWRTKALKSFTTSSWGGSAFDYDVDARDFTVKAAGNWLAGGWQQLTQAGLDLRDWDRLNNFGSTARSQARGAFVRHEWSLSRDTSVSAGVRLDRVQRRASFSRPQDAHPQAWEAGGVQRLTDEFSIWGRIGTSYRLASVDELPPSGGAAPDLRAQKSADREAGLRWSRQGIKVDFRLYRHALSDEIAYDPSVPGAFGFGANVNLDPTLRQGLEVEASWPIASGWQVQPHASWRQAEYRAGPRVGRDIPLVPTQAWGLRIVGDIAGGHQWSGGLSGVASSYVDSDNTCKVPASVNLDMRYTYTWRDVEASVGVANLLDRRYFTTAFGCAGGLPSSVYPEPGRVASFRVKVSF